MGRAPTFAPLLLLGASMLLLAAFGAAGIGAPEAGAAGGEAINGAQVGEAGSPPHSAQAAPAQRIVSSNPCSDALLTELADRSQIAAISKLSGKPSSSSMDVALANSLPQTGSSAEEILAKRPDVVISGGGMDRATSLALGRLGVRVIELPVANSVDESEAQIRQIAALTGHGARGEALIARIEAAMRAAAPAADGDIAALLATAADPYSPRAARPASQKPITALVWQGGGLVPGQGTLIDDLMRRTGFANVSAAMGLEQWDVLPLEAMIAQPPQVILAADAGASQDDRLLAHPALRQLADASGGKVAVRQFSPKLVWCAGPSIIAAAGRLGELRRSMGQRQHTTILATQTAEMTRP